MAITPSWSFVSSEVLSASGRAAARRVRRGTLTTLGTWVNGTSIAVTAKGLGMISHLRDLVVTGGGYLWEFDRANLRLIAKRQAVGTLFLSHSGADIKGSANTDAANADQAASPTNGALLKALALVSAAPYTVSTNPDRGRNVAIVVANDSGGALDLYEGTTTFAVTGTWKGAAQSENITLTSTSGNKSIANTKYRYVYGSKPFDTVTGVAITNAPAATLKVSVGIGSKIGLPNALKTPLESDVVKITKNAAHLATTDIVDTTNMTVNLGALTDNDDFTLVYGTAAVVSAPAVEVATGETVAVTAEFTAVGW